MELHTKFGAHGLINYRVVVGQTNPGIYQILVRHPEGQKILLIPSLNFILCWPPDISFRSLWPFVDLLIVRHLSNFCNPKGQKILLIRSLNFFFADPLIFLSGLFWPFVDLLHFGNPYYVIFSVWHSFTKMAVSPLIMVRFSKFKIWHAQHFDADLLRVRNIMSDVMCARSRHVRDDVTLCKVWPHCHWDIDARRRHGRHQRDVIDVVSVTSWTSPACRHWRHQCSVTSLGPYYYFWLHFLVIKFVKIAIESYGNVM